MNRYVSLILMLFLILPSLSHAESGKYVFEHVQTSGHWVNDMFQDRDGFMWITTRNGLYRYVGYGTNGYYPVCEGDAFYDIFQDSEGYLWVKKRAGFVRYDPRTGVFLDEMQTAALLETDAWIGNFALDALNDFWWNDGNDVYVQAGYSGRRVKAGSVDESVVDIFCRNNIAYVLTWSGRIRRFGIDAGKEVKVLPDIVLADAQVDFDHQFIRIFVDSSQNVWVLQGPSCVWLCPYGSAKPRMVSLKSVGNSVSPTYVTSVTEDSEGYVWIASDHGGITICDKEGNVRTQLKNDPMDCNTIASDGVYSLYRDNSGNVWVGYTKMGLSVYRGKSKTWAMTHLDSIHGYDLRDDINATCEGADGSLWFGTDGYGLVKKNPHTGEETVYTRENSALRSNVVTDIHCDGCGRIWVGTFYGGLSCIENGIMTTYAYKEDGGGLSSDNVWAIDHDALGRIWIATLGGGVQMIDPETDEIVTFRSEDGLSNDSVLDVECSDDGNVYAATSYGLSIIEPHTNSVRALYGEPLERSIITGVLVDSRGLVWLDEDGLLQIFDPVSYTFRVIDDPALKAVRGFVPNDSESVWVITDSGVCLVEVMRSIEHGFVFDVSSFSFPHQEDVHFNQRSACMTSSGDLLIGSFCGYMTIYPSRLLKYDAEKSMNLHFTDLYVGNVRIVPQKEYNGEVILYKTLDHTESVSLSHETSVISVDFVNLDYMSVENKPLYYQMKGMAGEWIPADLNTGRLTFNNIVPGRYVLYITPDIGDLSKGISLSVIVRQPWWRTWPAIISYVLLFIGTAVVAVVLRRRWKREREIQQENSIMRERRHYLDEMKMEFFTNVSHDFRTPLTLILTPVEEYIAKYPEKRGDPLISNVYRNAQRLLNLVNEVLDLRKIEMYGTQLNLTSGDLVQMVNDSVSSFRLMAESQGIRLTSASDVDALVFDFDQGKIVKVLTNLLSNAFKFTPSGGEISVRVHKCGDASVCVSVSDTGPGVQDKEKKRIFDRFYQAKDSPAGSGIGLHVVREFVALHGGEIEVHDNEPAGSVFSFTLPVRTSDESVNVVDDEGDAGHVEIPDEQSGRSTVLIVDDNDDFRTFMCASLSDEYKVFAASDGSEAIKIVESNDIDVVISDVMMPVMDGNELCRRMKSDINTSHIPIILLTAKAMQDDEYSGLESGADDYLVKPFNMSILRLRVSKFIEWKKRSKRMFEKELEVATEQITITTMDDRLLQQAINVINENIGNPDFSVAELSAALCMHRTSLYKKLVYIIGKTPVEFIRSMRLKRAAVLLETDGVYVSEIAYMVGFNSPKVFARHFKEEFGCSPTDYRRRQGLNR